VRLEYERTHGDRRGEALEPLMMPVPCSSCGGGRLKPEALAVTVHGAAIHRLLSRTVDEALVFFKGWQDGSGDGNGGAAIASADLALDLAARLASLRDAGLGYLALDRAAATLSGGEAQRVRLAAGLRSGLTGITYVLDEPTAGLHARDTGRLLGLLFALRDAGNTVVVVEHDTEVIEAADHVIEIGPGAGPRGGRVMASGPPPAIAASDASVTAPFLARRRQAHAEPARRALVPGIAIRGASVHNLRCLDVDVPAGGLVAVTGVSGSGKSSLVFDVMVPSLERALSGPRGAGGATGTSAPVNCNACDLQGHLVGLAAVGAAPLPASPWSNPATYVGCFDAIRAVFAATAQAKALGFRKAHFATSGPGGRCESCEGRGQTRVSMDFLPDVWVACEECGGTGYGSDALTCLAGGRSISDVMSMNADEAVAWAEGLANPRIASARTSLDALREVGLGYLRIGQPMKTLSGGERQRLALAAALAGPAAGPTLFVCDEPTTGLHPADVEGLLRVFARLIDARHTIIAVEHNLDVVSRADWVIDLGPEGGPGGGQVVVAGTPESVMACAASHTGRALRGARRG
jgi:excinuclease ABC subunit A